MANEHAARIMKIHYAIRELTDQTKVIIWKDLCMAFARQIDGFSGNLHTTEASVKEATSYNDN